MLITMLAGLGGACTLPPPDSVVGLAARLSGDRILFDQAKMAAIIGSPVLNPNNLTRIPGVTLEYSGAQGRKNETRVIQFDLKGNCTRVEDFKQWFGKATSQILITDGGGWSYAWDIRHSVGNVRVVLSRMYPETACAPELWIAQTWRP